jgi:hypothetical protein
MKKIGVWVAVMMCVLASVSFGALLSEDPGELSAKGQLWSGDGDFDLFKFGYGAQLSYREWFAFPWGVGVNAGIANWDVDGNSHAYKSGLLSDYKGSATTVPFGFSLFFCAVDWENWMITLDTGLQYWHVMSDVTVLSSRDNKRHDVDIGGAVIWHVGMDVDYLLTESTYITGGLGYQVDTIKANTKCDGDSLRDSSFASFFFRAGVKFVF